jgi:hypothetical protein
MKRWDTVQRALEDDLAHGCGPIQLVAEAPFYDESLLPFSVAGGGRILRIVPERGFRKEALTETADERLLVVDCPDDEGWLVPADVVAAWYGRHVPDAPRRGRTQPRRPTRPTRAVGSRHAGVGEPLPARILARG